MARRILVVDDIATNRLTLRVRLARLGFDVLQADSRDAALELAKLASPDLILLNDGMGDMSGADLCRELKAGGEEGAALVIVMTEHKARESRIAALKAGADELLTKPLDDLTLMARVRSLLRARETHAELTKRQSTTIGLGFEEASAGFERAASVSVISSNPGQIDEFRSAIGKLTSYHVIPATPDEAISKVSEGSGSDLYVLGDQLLRPGGALALVSDLRAYGGSRYSAILTTHAFSDRADAAAALDLGANDIVTLPLDPEELALRVRSQMRRKLNADRLRTAIDDDVAQSVRDPLTGLFNRRYADRYLDRALQDARRSGHPIAVLMIDIDHFKGINDQLGHASGDLVLQRLADVLRNSLRGESMVARWGGEEFVAVLPGASPGEAGVAARRICHTISAEPFLAQRVEPSIGITASVGAAIGRPAQTGWVTPEKLVDRADRALYRAKAAGRNRFDLDATLA